MTSFQISTIALSDSELDQLDAICDAFEAKWRSDSRCPIENLLDGIDKTILPIVTAELVKLEWELRSSSGERPSNEEYLVRFPGLFKVDMEGSAIKDQPACQPGESGLPRSLEDDDSPIALGAADNVGHYQVECVLGHGGMASVYLARDTRLDRRVALKMPWSSHLCDAGVLQRFHREMRAMAGVHHPNLCSIYDVGDVNGHPYLVMAYIEGETLADRLRKSGSWPPFEAAILVSKLARAISHLHDARLVHRDIKPANVMLDARDEPIVMDFGLTHAAFADDNELAHSGTLLGSPPYMAPEQFAYGVEVGPRVDIYALGVILYELLCGCRPYQRKMPALANQIVQGVATRPSQVSSTVDERIDFICTKAMAAASDHRFSTANELAEALDEYVAWTTRPIPLAPEAPEPRERRQVHGKMPFTRFALVALSLLSLVTVSGLAWRAYRWLSASAQPLPPETTFMEIPDGEDSEPSNWRTFFPPFQDSGYRLDSDRTGKILLADLDADGDLDIISVAKHRAARVWLNQGNGEMVDIGQSISVVGETGVAMALDHLDSDRFLDVLAVSDQGKSAVWLGDAHGHFTHQTEKVTGFGKSINQVGLADFNGDGRPDAALSASGRGIQIAFGKEGLTWEPVQSIEVGNCIGFALADFDQDGWVDLSVASAAGYAQIFMNDGAGRLVAGSKTSGIEGCLSIATGDLTGDRRSDVCITTQRGSFLWQNDGHGDFEPTLKQFSVGAAAAVAFSDLNFDGRLDIVEVPGSASEPEIRVYLNQGRGRFRRADTIGELKAGSVATGDLDGDGDEDLIFGNTEGADQLWFNMMRVPRKPRVIKDSMPKGQ